MRAIRDRGSGVEGREEEKWKKSQVRGFIGTCRESRRLAQVRRLVISCPSVPAPASSSS